MPQYTLWGFRRFRKLTFQCSENKKVKNFSDLNVWLVCLALFTALPSELFSGPKSQPKRERGEPGIPTALTLTPSPSQRRAEPSWQGPLAWVWHFDCPFIVPPHVSTWRGSFLFVFEDQVRIIFRFRSEIKGPAPPQPKRPTTGVFRRIAFSHFYVYCALAGKGIIVVQRSSGLELNYLCRHWRSVEM